MMLVRVRNALFLEATQTKPHSIVQCELLVLLEGGTIKTLCNFDSIALIHSHDVEVLWQAD